MAVMTALLDLLQPLHPPPPPQALPPPPIPGEPERAEEAAEAHARAADILAQARREAEEMREDARVLSEALREAAWQEGFHNGQEAGRDAIEIKLRGEWKAEQQALRAQVQTLVEGIGAARQALWERQEAEMVAFVLTVARQVIKTEVSQNPEVVRGVIQNALRRVTDREQVRIRVSVGDAGHVRAIREDLLTILDGLRHLEIVDDRRIGDGGCVIETNAGTIDAKIETQLAEVERALGPLPALPELGAEGADD
ncbi:MAG: hypothetical protein JO250_08005 [Armatimonadetes bacterium]|nr:hypothetical protein [Armatimonadota bacterium]